MASTNRVKVLRSEEGCESLENEIDLNLAFLQVKTVMTVLFYTQFTKKTMQM